MGLHLRRRNLEAPGVTGILLDFYEIGLMLFVVGLFLPFVWRRVAAMIGLVAAFLCLPVFLYDTLPALFRPGGPPNLPLFSFAIRDKGWPGGPPNLPVFLSPYETRGAPLLCAEKISEYVCQESWRSFSTASRQVYHLKFTASAPLRAGTKGEPRRASFVIYRFSS